MCQLRRFTYGKITQVASETILSQRTTATGHTRMVNQSTAATYFPSSARLYSNVFQSMLSRLKQWNIILRQTSALTNH
jgi:hypothetical protein